MKLILYPLMLVHLLINLTNNMKKMTKKSLTLTSLIVGMAVFSTGCCSITGKWTNKENSEWDPGCHLLGNLIFGGPIGFVLDIITNAAWETTSYMPAPEDHPERVLAVHLNDGRVLVLRDIPAGSEVSKQIKRTHLPEKFIVKTEWVMKRPKSDS